MTFEGHLVACRQELVAYCRHLLWEKRELEDAVQDVVLCAFREFTSFTGGSFKRWLFAIATNVVFNLNRKRRSRPVPPVEPVDAAVELGLEEAYDAILKDPSRALSTLDEPLRSCLEQLNDSERAIFLLRSIVELKYQEIAEALAVPVGTVMGTLSRARIKLRKLLAERSHAM
jgi:RNA polymerase sigma-70 factor (ECF subfamily)